MTQKTSKSGKVRVMLQLDPEVAKALRIKAAILGCRGVSEYITDFVAKTYENQPVEVKHDERG